MSLINKMLRDLDERNAPSVDRSALPSHVRPLPPERREIPKWILPVAAVLIAVAGWAMLGGRGETPPEPAHAPVAQVPVQAPLPASMLAAPAAKVEVVPNDKVANAEKHPAHIENHTSPNPPAERKAVAKSDEDTLRLETALPKVRDKNAPALAAVQPAPVAPPPVKSAAASIKESPPPNMDPGAIDKRPRTSAASDAADTEYRKGLSAVRRGALAEAIERLQAALRLDSHHISARQALLSLLVEQQQWGEAQSLLDEGLAIDPAQTGWAMALARLQLENGKLADAVGTLAQHAKYADQNADYMAFHALLLQKQKRSREAAERYRAALALKPTEARWWYGLGVVLETDQKTQEAREAFLKAREIGNLPPELAGAVEQKLR